MKKKTDKSKIAAVALAAVLCFGAVFFGVHIFGARSPRLPSAEIGANIAPLPDMGGRTEDSSRADDTSEEEEENSDDVSSCEESSLSSAAESSYVSSESESSSLQSSRAESSQGAVNSQQSDTSRVENSRSETQSVRNDSSAVSASSAGSGDVTSVSEKDLSSAESSRTPVTDSSSAEKVTVVTPKPAPDGSKTDKEYFTTTIKNGETVKDEVYFFEVTHLDSSLKLRSCEVSVNGGEAVLFSGRCTLIPGKNTIRITCTYTDQKNTVVRAFKDYTVELKNEKPVIDTDLNNSTVHDSSFTFTATGKQGSRSIPVDIDINGVLLGCDGKVTVTLSEGENVITLTCGGTQRIFTVNYEPLPDPDILTDLTDMSVYGKEFSFTASCIGDDTAKLTVQLNGRTVRSDNGKYTCTLDFGTNNIRLLMRGRTDIEKNFTITCIPEYNEAELPVLTKMNVTDGMEVTGNALSVRLTAQDYLGNRIYSGKLVFTVNGNTLNRAWEDGTETGYEVTLSSGENTIAVSLTDNDGRQREYRYTVHSNEADTNTETGHISITVNADLVGQGTICSDGNFPVYSGETGFDTVQRFLNDNGYTVYFRGSDNSRYLCGIGMGGRFASASPTDTARAYLEEKGITYTEDHNADILGEFDFTAGSGWIYKRNGKIPGYALTSTVLGDGESIELFFSLDYGNDIRSFYP